MNLRFTPLFVAVISLLVAGHNAVGAAPNHLLITRVQISGSVGHTTDDFVELYNPTPSAIDLKGYRLVKRSANSTNDTSLKSWTASVLIAPHSYYLWANSGYANIGVAPNTTTSATLSTDNAVGLRLGAANSGALIDSVAWGKAANGLIDGMVFPNNPQTGQMLQRKTSGDDYQDTNNNAEDFVLAPSATPHADPTATPPAVTPLADANQVTKSAAPPKNTINSKPSLTATIVAPPGMFTSSSAFITNPDARLVLSGRNYPVLEVGDQVLVRGTTSVGLNGTEINVTSPSNLVRQASGNAPAPQSVSLDEISNAFINHLIKTSGTVSKTSATTFTIANQGKTLRVAPKNKQVDWPEVVLGDEAMATGVIVLSGGELQLWPRTPDDLTFTEATPPADSPPPAAQPKPEANSNGYLVLALAATVIGGAYLWQRYQLPTVSELAKKLWKK